MSDFLRPPARASWREPVGRTDHPVLAGSLAVSLVAMLVMASRLCADPDWGSIRLLFVLACGAFGLGLVGVAVARAPGRQGEGVLGAASRMRIRPGISRHRCFVPAHRSTTMLMQDGRRLPARITALSMTTVTIEARLTEREYRSVCRVGTREVGPVAYTETGAVFGFARILDPQHFDESFVL